MPEWPRQLVGKVGPRLALRRAQNCTRRGWSVQGEVEDLIKTEVINLSPNITSEALGHWNHSNTQGLLPPRDTMPNFQDNNMTVNVMDKRLNVLGALYVLAGWLQISKETIWNCWRKARFMQTDQQKIKVENKDDSPVPTNYDDWRVRRMSGHWIGDSTIWRADNRVARMIYSWVCLSAWFLFSNTSTVSDVNELVKGFCRI